MTKTSRLVMEAARADGNELLAAHLAAGRRVRFSTLQSYASYYGV